MQEPTAEKYKQVAKNYRTLKCALKNTETSSAHVLKQVQHMVQC
jgi:hypothetical protein